jgi:hypothetical protein
MTQILESDPLWIALQAELLREIAHDLRGRSMALRGFAELQEMAGSRAKAQEVRLPPSEVTELETLVRDLEAVNVPSRPEVPELTSLVPEVARAVEVLRRLGGRRIATVLVEPPLGDPPAVRVPLSQLRRLIMVALAGVAGPVRTQAGCDVKVRVEKWEKGAQIVVHSSAAIVGVPEKPELLVSFTESTWQWRADESGAELQLSFFG